MFLALFEGRVKTTKKAKKGLFGPFGGPYGGIPKVFGEGPIGVYGGSEEEKG